MEKRWGKVKTPLGLAFLALTVLFSAANPNLANGNESNPQSVNGNGNFALNTKCGCTVTSKNDNAIYGMKNMNKNNDVKIAWNQNTGNSKNMLA